MKSYFYWNLNFWSKFDFVLKYIFLRNRFHFCLRTSGREASTRFAGPGPQWAIVHGIKINLITDKIIIRADWLLWQRESVHPTTMKQCLPSNKAPIQKLWKPVQRESAPVLSAGMPAFCTLQSLCIFNSTAYGTCKLNAIFKKTLYPCPKDDFENRLYLVSDKHTFFLQFWGKM